MEKLEIVELDANGFTMTDDEERSFSRLAERIRESIPLKLTVFFDSTNFLVTRYFLSGSGNAVMLIETGSGKQFQIHNCNCGYGGHGPRNTERILTALGMSPELVEHVITERGIQISFKDDGTLAEETVKTDFPFDSRANHLKDGAIGLKTVAVNLEQKQIYFFDCTGSNILSIFACLDLVKAESFEYYIGDNCHFVRNFNIPYVPNTFKSDDLTLNGSFVWVNAKPFSIICFIGNEAPFAYVNTIGCAVNGKVVFRENYNSIYPNISTNAISSMSIWRRIKLAVEWTMHCKKDISYHDVIFNKGGR